MLSLDRHLGLVKKPRSNIFMYVFRWHHADVHKHLLGLCFWQKGPPTSLWSRERYGSTISPSQRVRSTRASAQAGRYCCSARKSNPSARQAMQRLPPRHYMRGLLAVCLEYVGVLIVGVL